MRMLRDRFHLCFFAAVLGFSLGVTPRAMGENSAASRIEGIVQARNDTAYMLRISSVQYLNGQSNKWSGESLTVPANLVSGARIREFSRSRTTAVGGIRRIQRQHLREHPESRRDPGHGRASVHAVVAG